MPSRAITPAEAGKLDEIIRPLVQGGQLPGKIVRQRLGFKEILRIANAVMIPPPAGTPDAPLGHEEEVLRQVNGIEDDNRRNERWIDPIVLQTMNGALQKIRATLGARSQESATSSSSSMAESAGTFQENKVNNNGHIDSVSVSDPSPQVPAVARDSDPSPRVHQSATSQNGTPPAVRPHRKRATVRLQQKLDKGEPSGISEELIDLARDYGLEIGGDRAMEIAWQRLITFAESPMTMLIRGQSGTGKEPFAQAAHRHRKKKGLTKADDLIDINCAAINSGIAESELFGHVKGAFTGAIENRAGKFEAANNGTLFLDEVGDMPHEQQAKLLRVLENGTFSPAGSNKVLTTQVKVICATNRPLEKLVEAGKFRNDLLQRLKACQVQLPSWQDRDEAHQKAVIDFLVPKLRAKYKGKHLIDISPEGYLYLLDTHFPGNVREVKNLMERAYVFASQQIKEGSLVMLDRRALENATDEQPAVEPSGPMVRHGALEYGKLAVEDGGHSLPFILHLPSSPDIRAIQMQLNEILAHLMYQGPAHGHVGDTANMLNVSRRSLSAWLHNYEERKKDTKDPPNIQE